MFAAKLCGAMGAEGESVDEVQLLVFRSAWLFKFGGNGSLCRVSTTANKDPSEI